MTWYLEFAPIILGGTMDETGLSRRWPPLKLGDGVTRGSVYFVLYFCICLEFFHSTIFPNISFFSPKWHLVISGPVPPTIHLQRSQSPAPWPETLMPSNVLMGKMAHLSCGQKGIGLEMLLLWDSPLPTFPTYTRQAPGARGADFSQQLTGPHKKQSHSLNTFISLIPVSPYDCLPLLPPTWGSLCLRGRKYGLVDLAYPA